jgi:hypothetical protein
MRTIGTGEYSAVDLSSPWAIHGLDRSFWLAHASPDPSVTAYLGYASNWVELSKHVPRKDESSLRFPS